MCILLVVVSLVVEVVDITELVLLVLVGNAIDA
jgi:hypothetical protein